MRLSLSPTPFFMITWTAALALACGVPPKETNVRSQTQPAKPSAEASPTNESTQNINSDFLLTPSQSRTAVELLLTEGMKDMATSDSLKVDDMQLNASIEKIVSAIHESQRKNPASMSPATAETLAQQTAAYLTALHKKDTATATSMLQLIASTSGLAQQQVPQQGMALILPGLFGLPLAIGAAGLNFIGGLVATGINVVSAVAQGIPVAIERSGETLVHTLITHRVPINVEIKIPTLGEYVPTLGFRLPILGVSISRN